MRIRFRSKLLGFKVAFTILLLLTIIILNAYTIIKWKVRFFKWGCVGYFSIVNYLRTVDVSLHAPSLEKEAGV